MSPPIALHSWARSSVIPSKPLLLESFGYFSYHERVAQPRNSLLSPYWEEHNPFNVSPCADQLPSLPNQRIRFSLDPLSWAMGLPRIIHLEMFSSVHFDYVLLMPHLHTDGIPGNGRIVAVKRLVLTVRGWQHVSLCWLSRNHQLSSDHFDRLDQRVIASYPRVGGGRCIHGHSRWSFIRFVSGTRNSWTNIRDHLTRASHCHSVSSWLRISLGTKAVSSGEWTPLIPPVRF